MFDPNNINTKKLNYTHDWATYIPSRSPKFKIHGRKGLAISAIRGKYIYNFRLYNKDKKSDYSLAPGIQLFQLVEGKWVDIPLVQEYNGSIRTLKSPIVAENV